MKIETFRDVWIDELKDLYSAEHQLCKALPKMARAATDDALRDAFAAHLEQTRGHLGRLAAIFAMIDATNRGKKCIGMEGLIAQGAEMLELELPEAVSDAALIAAAQRVEHYEIAAYGSARTYAQILGEIEAAALLDETLEEEKAADRLLTGIATRVNAAAAGGRPSVRV